MALLPVLAVGAGCSQPKYNDLQHFAQAHTQDVGDTVYRLEPPDIVAISSPTCPEIDNEIQQVRSDGKLSLRLLGEVKVSGLAPRELAAKLEDLLKKYYTNPSVSVQVAGFESRKVYVFGQVTRGGKHPYTGRDTVLDMLSKSGPTSLAWGAQVKIIRPSAAPDERHEIVINVDEMMQSGDLRNNYLLKEGDIVLEGRLSGEDIETVREFLADNEGFRPDNVGIPDLVEQMPLSWSPTGEERHDIARISYTNAKPTAGSVDADHFVSGFEAIDYRAALTM